jgi:phage-related tail fiber protein
MQVILSESEYNELRNAADIAHDAAAAEVRASVDKVTKAGSAALSRLFSNAGADPYSSCCPAPMVPLEAVKQFVAGIYDALDRHTLVTKERL